MSIGLITLLLFACLFTLMLLGMEISFALLITGIIFTLALWGPRHLFVLASSMQGSLSTEVYIAIPLFILMGNVLAHTGIADELFQALHLWTARLRGGLAMGTVGSGTILAAMCGSSEAGTLTVGLMALPAMLKRGYDAGIAIGSIAAGGLLGFLIPPSVITVVYAGIAGVSLGKLYFASFLPGLLLAGLYILYIGVRSALQPGLCPSIPRENAPTWKEKTAALRKVILPLGIIVLVLGGIYGGVTTPTEAAGVGVFSAFVVAIFKNRLTFKALKGALLDTFKLMGMIGWIIACVTVFSNVYNALGAPKIVGGMLEYFPAGGFGVVIFMQLAIFILGTFMDDFALLFLTMPIFVPIIKNLGFDPIWFGVLILINMQCALLTPPYGFNLFYMRAITPPHIGTLTIYKGVLPFIGLQILCLILVMTFPEIATWLPELLVKK
ncbi:MAG: TRAP transporter large permease subunit [Pseudomonadota bacterium]